MAIDKEDALINKLKRSSFADAYRSYMTNFSSPPRHAIIVKKTPYLYSDEQKDTILKSGWTEEEFFNSVWHQMTTDVK